MTKDELADISGRWLAAIDVELADLIDKSRRLDARRFQAEIEHAIARVPALFDRLDTQHLSNALEDEVGESIIEALR